MPRLENWTRMRDKSRVVPSPKHPEVGDIVGGDVFGSQNHDEGKTITTGDVVEVRPGAVVTRSKRSEGGTETYELGKWLWDDPDARKSLGDPLIARVFEDRNEVTLGVEQSVTVRFRGSATSIEIKLKDAGWHDGKAVDPEILVTVKESPGIPVRIEREGL